MALARETQHATTAIERQRAASATVQRSATAVPSSVRMLQERLGNRGAQAFGEVRQSLRVPQPQPKLAVSTPGDRFEREADRVAEEVMRMTDPSPLEIHNLDRSPVQRMCGGCENEAKDAEEMTVQRKCCPSAMAEGREVQRSGEGGAPAAVTPAVENLRGGGEPLSQGIRGFFEPRFGRDLSAVRVHDGAEAASAAHSIHALAYTVGTDIVFGAGQYQPSGEKGRQLIAHELTHVVQQGALGSQVQRQSPPVAAVDPELDLGQRLRSSPFSAGFALAFYDTYEAEAKRRAEDFATRENAIGLKGRGGVTAANLVVGKPISGVRDVETTVPAISHVVNNALAKVPADPSLPPASVTAPGKVRALAIFAHGTSDWCSLGVTVSNAPGIFKAIAPNLSSTVRVILYTCSSGRGTNEDEDWVKGTMGGGGEGSLASTVRDTLAEEKIDSGSVWGHTTVGHVSRNFALREFTVAAGKGAEGQSYVSTYVFEEPERLRAIADLSADINALGYTISTADAAFIKAATAQLVSTFYSAYAEANKKLPGVNVAEEAPMYPHMTASRIVKYWSDVYWPANRAGVAKKVVAAMRLKKPKKP